MSVALKTLEGGQFFRDVEIMADSYDREYLWLWLSETGDNRLDLSRSQLRQLRDYLNDIL